MILFYSLAVTMDRALLFFIYGAVEAESWRLTDRNETTRGFAKHQVWWVARGRWLGVGSSISYTLTS